MKRRSVKRRDDRHGQSGKESVDIMPWWPENGRS
jgi:hypothetical protein